MEGHTLNIYGTFLKRPYVELESKSQQITNH